MEDIQNIKLCFGRQGSSNVVNENYILVHTVKNIRELKMSTHTNTTKTGLDKASSRKEYQIHKS